MRGTGSEADKLAKRQFAVPVNDARKKERGKGPACWLGRRRTVGLRGLLFLAGAKRNLYYAHLVYAMQLSRAISSAFFTLSL